MYDIDNNITLILSLLSSLHSLTALPCVTQCGVDLCIINYMHLNTFLRQLQSHRALGVLGREDT